MRQAKGSLFRPTVTRTVDGKKRRRKSKFYWVRYKDARGEMQCHVLTLSNGDRITDGEVPAGACREIQRRVEREAAGVVDRAVESAALSFRVIIARFVIHLRRRRVSAKYIGQSLSCIKTVMRKADIRRLADFHEERIERGLAAIAGSGRSPKTVNEYRHFCHSLAEWGINIARIMDRNPVAAAVRRNTAVDVRKVRRALTVAEAEQLLTVSGPRSLCYKFQLLTGLRVSEVRALEWRDVRVDSQRPHIHLRAATTKSKRADTIDLHPGLIDELMASREPGSLSTGRVFRTIPKLDTF